MNTSFELTRRQLLAGAGAGAAALFLESAGVEFIPENGGGAGVRLKKA